MRLLLGIIIGILLTIGAAYVYDSGHASVCAVGADCPIVNWNAADLRIHRTGEWLESAWHHLLHRV